MMMRSWTGLRVGDRFFEVFELDFHEPLCGNHGCACLEVSMFAAPLGRTHDLCSRTHDLCSRTHDLCSRTHDLCSRTHDLGSRTHDLCSRTHDLCSRTHDLCSRTHDLGSRTHDLGSRTHDLCSRTHDLGSRTHDLGSSTHDLGGICLSDQRKAHVTRLSVLCRNRSVMSQGLKVAQHVLHFSCPDLRAGFRRALSLRNVDASGASGESILEGNFCPSWCFGAYCTCWLCC